MSDEQRTDADYPSRRKVGAPCPRCGRMLTRMRRYADRPCRSCAARKGRDIMCAECGTEFYASPSQIARGRKYCSRRCWQRNARMTDEQYAENSQRLRVNRLGPGNPNFRHGERTGEHLQGWGVKHKGEEWCRVCGAQAEHLHHVVPRSICPAEAKRDLRNGLPLCASCHARWHRGSLKIPRSVFTAEEWDYITTIIGSPWLDHRYPESSDPWEVAA